MPRSAWPTIAMACATAVCAVSLHAAALPLAPQDTALPIGDERDLPLAAGTLATFTVTPDRDGPITVTATSLHADVVLQRRDEEGGILAQDDDGGPHWNARLVVDGRAGESLRFRTGHKQGQAGIVEVAVRRGETPLPVGAAAALADANFLHSLAQACEERGEAHAAASYFHGAGQLYIQNGEHALAEQAYDRVLTLAEGHQAEATLLAVAHWRLGVLAALSSDTDTAVTHLEDAQARAEALGRADLKMVIGSALARAYSGQGRNAEAAALLEDAYASAEAAGDTSNMARMAGQRGELRLEAGDHRGAREWYGRALEFARSEGERDDRSDEARALRNLGRYHLERGELRRAQELLEQALPLSADRLERLEVLGELGHAERRLGDYATAFEAYTEALELARELGDDMSEALVLASLGSVHQNVGDLRRARDLVEQSLAVLEHTGDAANLAVIRSNLASLLYELGDGDQARRTVEASLELAERTGDDVNLARAHAVLGFIAYHDGDYDEAHAAFERARTRAERADHAPLTAQALTQLAETELNRGNLGRAQTLIGDCLERLDSIDDLQLRVDALETQVGIALRRGDLELTASALAEAETLAESPTLRALDIDSWSMLRSRGDFSMLGEFHQDLVAARLDAETTDQDPVGEGFRQAGLWKGRALLAGISEHRQGSRSAAAIALRRQRDAILADRTSILQRIAAAKRQSPDTETIQVLMTASADLDRQADDLALRLRSVAPGEASLDVPAAISADVIRASVLPPGGVLVEFAQGREEIYAYVLDDEDLRFHRIGSREDVETQVEAFLDGISDPRSLAPPADVARRGRALHDLLLGPALANTDDGAPLVIVPTGALSGLPFEALVVDAEDDPRGFDEVTFVIDERRVSYGPSAPVLSLLAAVGPREQAGRTLMLADPVYAAESGGPLVRTAPALEDLPRLPGTRGEILGIAQVLTLPAPSTFSTAEVRDQRTVELKTDSFDLFMGEKAAAEQLQGDLRRYSVLHFATHGVVDMEDPRRSGLVLTMEDGGEGFLTVADILDLDLDADLAVLSACETGRGKVRRGEGVQSLARAFMYAGSRSVVASLWQVDDRETSRTMQALYTEMAAGRTPVEALHAARLSVRHAGAETGAFAGVGRGKPLVKKKPAAPDPAHVGHPYFWAPFVYIGLPR